MIRFLNRLIGCYWGKHRHLFAYKNELDCGCSDKTSTCADCGEHWEGPFFRKWWCPVHDPPDDEHKDIAKRLESYLKDHPKEADPKP